MSSGARGDERADRGVSPSGDAGDPDGRADRAADDGHRSDRRPDLTRELRRAALLHRRALLAQVRPPT